jgi:hypothetical protein
MRDHTKGAPPGDRALIIGINAYPGAALAGCLNDAADMRALASDSGFAPEGVRVLVDSDATTSAIKAGLAWLAAVPEGGKCLLSYSGHGAQVPNPDEPDGLSEVICPVDFDWSPDRMITDKQFVQAFARMAPGVKFNWVNDSCHSGDLDRELHKGPAKAPKCITPPQRIITEICDIRSRAHRLAKLREIGSTVDVGFVAACRSDQTAADTRVDGRPCGALTHFFLRALKERDGAPLTDVVGRARLAMAASGYDQVPQAEGPRAKNPFLR